MSLLTIRPGFSINIDDIVAVERQDQGSVVYTQNQQFDSVVSYATLLELINKREREKKEEVKKPLFGLNDRI